MRNFARYKMIMSERTAAMKYPEKVKSLYESAFPPEEPGENVGLPDGQMGNSEVGHLNIGAGRVVYQDLVKMAQCS